MPDAARVRESFAEQAQWCLKLGSPFTALLCQTLGDHLDEDTVIGRDILSWTGDPRASADALALRVAGALHALAKEVPALTALYPPAPLPDASALWRACRASFQSHAAHFRRYLALAPQTNEVGRCGVLIAGFLEFSRRYDTPVHLFEIGASAGLNLVPDRYRYRFAQATWGDPHSPLELAPEWTGVAPPVDANFRVASRQGADLAPIDLSVAADRERLLSYVWPDQCDRRRRIELAIDTVRAHPTRLDAMDAAQWVEQRLPAEDSARDGARVLFHSVFWSYLPQSTQRRIEARVAACGAAATAARPFGWLRFELDSVDGPAALTLSSWPCGETRRLARAHPHGRTVTYLP
jgi:hypothetical protein